MPFPDKYWKTIVAAIQDGVMVINPEGTIVFVNPAFENMMGYTAAEMVGKPCAILKCNIFELTCQNRGGSWCSLFETGELNLNRCTLMRKDKRMIHVLKKATLLYDPNGKIFGAIESVTDISGLIKTDEQSKAVQYDLTSRERFHGMVGASIEMKRVFNMVSNAAQSDAPVILRGESGTGKEMVADAIHAIGPRNQKPMVKVNCAALSDTLLESELFGHVKGAYTGAVANRKGRFEAAAGGDIFLDEIGDLPLFTQIKLLRVLEENVIERVGDSRTIPVDVRIISATNRNLEELVENRLFRKDLYYRINVVPINIPSLRDRTEDISLLADTFFHRLRLKSGKQISGIQKQTLDIFMQYIWPGNVRELKSALEYAFVTCHAGEIAPEHLPQSLFEHHVSSSSAVLNRSDDPQRQHLIEALKQAHGNQSRAADILGVSRVTVWKRMKKYAVQFNKTIDC